jgi:hypothetical protein
MALQKQMTINAKFVGEMSIAGYIKVERVAGRKDNIEATVVITKSGTDDVVSSSVYEFAPDLNGPNFIEQAYEHLKTLPEFAGAADV